MADRRGNQPQVPEWDLPVRLRPVAAGPLLPTANLLGWTPATPLSNDQESTILSAGITLINFDVVNVAGFPLNPRLISFVSGIVENSKSKAFQRMPTATQGSVAQCCYSIRTQDDNQILPLKGISKKGATTHSYAQTSSHIASAASVFRLRLMRRPGANNDSVCYRFAGAVPAAWFNRANDTFVFGGGALWNTAQFGAGTHDGAGLALHFSTRVRKST